MCECGVCALPLPTFAPPTCLPLFDPLALATFSPGASFSLLIPPVPPGRVERRKCDDALSLNAFNVRPRGRTWGTLNTSDGKSLMPPVRFSNEILSPLSSELASPPFTYSYVRARDFSRRFAIHSEYTSHLFVTICKYAPEHVSLDNN